VVAGEAGEMERESCHFWGVQFVVLWKNIKIRESRRKNWRRSWVQAKRPKKKIYCAIWSLFYFIPCIQILILLHFP